jgi:hypothetical protein
MNGIRLSSFVARLVSPVVIAVAALLVTLSGPARASDIVEAQATVDRAKATFISFMAAHGFKRKYPRPRAC